MRTTAKENAGRKSPDAWECRSVWRPWPWLPPEALVEFGIGGTAPLNSCRSPVRRQLQPGNKMVLGLPLAHIASYFADNRHRRHHVDAVDLGQVRTCHAKQLFPQIKLWIAFLLLAPCFSGLFWQSGPLGPILSLREVLRAVSTSATVSNG